MTYLDGVGVVGVGLAGAVLVARLVSRVRLDSDCCLAKYRQCHTGDKEDCR